jgi:TolB-like protein
MRVVLVGMVVVAVGSAVALGLLRSRETATAVVVGPDVAAPGVAVELARTPPQTDTVRVPAVLTRADSIAIADAVRKRFEEDAARKAKVAAGQATGAASGTGTGATPAPAAAPVAPRTGVVVVRPGIPDSLGPEYRKALQDSLLKMAEAIRMTRGIDVRAMQQLAEMGRVVTIPPSSPHGPEEVEILHARRRVLVLDFQNGTGDPEMAPVGTALADSIRGALKRHGLEAVVVPREAVSGSRGVGSIARQMGIGTIVAGSYQRMGDSLVARVQIVDAVFGRNAGVIPMHHLPPQAPLAGAAPLAERVARGIVRTLPGRGQEPRFRFETAPRPKPGGAEGAAPPPPKPPIP